MICELCPRNCHAIRTKSDGAGYCGMPELPCIARAAAHFGEEPCISGTRGSGAIFFAGCSLGCVFCQNGVISHNRGGRAVSAEELRAIMRQLESSGVHNINLVTGSHFAVEIAKALESPLSVPVVYNCGGYESEKTLDLLRGKIQIYMPDLKFLDNSLSSRYCHCPNYPEVATSAILRMYEQTGPYVLDEDGIMKSGVMIRHLIMPGAVKNTKRVIDWVRESFGDGEILFSLMSQYTPINCEGFPEINRPISRREYDMCEQYLFDSGFEDGFLQDFGTNGTEFIPNFDLTGKNLTI
ncbi:MAG: radical SAM protein [Oscillospiraceae bacterium]